MAVHSLNGETTGGDVRQAPLNAGNTWINPRTENSDSVPQILIGYQEDGFGDGINYGIKVSQFGYDVNEASDSQLIMSSAFNNFKISATGTIRVYKSANSSWAVNYVDLTSLFASASNPAILVFADYNNELLPSTYATDSGTYAGYVQLSFNYEVDDQPYLFLEVTAPNYGAGSNTAYVQSLDVSFRYYILEETAT